MIFLLFSTSLFVTNSRLVRRRRRWLSKQYFMFSEFFSAQLTNDPQQPFFLPTRRIFSIVCVGTRNFSVFQPSTEWSEKCIAAQPLRTPANLVISAVNENIFGRLAEVSSCFVLHSIPSWKTSLKFNFARLYLAFNLIVDDNLLLNLKHRKICAVKQKRDKVKWRRDLAHIFVVLSFFLFFIYGYS